MESTPNKEKPQPHIQAAGCTHPGLRRKNNEDALFINDEIGLYIVSDGMGGHAAGEVASRMAIETVSRLLLETRDIIGQVRRRQTHPDTLATIMKRAIQAACQEIHQEAWTNSARQGMGCTLTALVIADSKAIMAHVGDTRLYLYRNRELHQLSTDHTMVAELLRAGAINPEQASESRYAHVLTRTVGTQESVQVEKLVIDVMPCDRFVICSDGLSDYLNDLKWFKAQLEQQSLNALPDDLVRFANEAGGRDNITVVAIDVLPHDDDGEAVVMPPGSRSQVDFITLRSMFLFAELSLAHLSRVLNICTVRNYQPGETLMEANTPCERMIIVMDGKLAMARDDVSVRTLTRGDHVGAMSLLHSCQSRFRLLAQDETRVLCIEKAAFRRLLQVRPRLGVVLLERLARQVSLELHKANDLTKQAFASAEGMELLSMSQDGEER